MFSIPASQRISKTPTLHHSAGISNRRGKKVAFFCYTTCCICGGFVGSYLVDLSLSKILSDLTNSPREELPVLPERQSVPSSRIFDVLLSLESLPLLADYTEPFPFLHSWPTFQEIRLGTC